MEVPLAELRDGQGVLGQLAPAGDALKREAKELHDLGPNRGERLVAGQPGGGHPLADDRREVRLAGLGGAITDTDTCGGGRSRLHPGGLVKAGEVRVTPPPLD
ncbi:hypothetical protein [Streptomyces sp. NBC_01235]|uniref:hypothetical protein n=1 Tax=Streptomyces sp. NBC_01235 TaxID=2903788 RepID=UPI002E1066B0|nr:hypothetical protein OG289_45365 [Streptomyces sp. NBC_01235]